MNISVKNLDIDDLVSFWDEYPQFKILSPFSKLYKKDNTKDKEYSSRVLWVIALVYCEDSIYADQEPLDYRKDFVAKDMMEGKIKFGWDKPVFNIPIQEIEQSFIELTTTQAQRTLAAMKNKLYEFQKVFEDNPVKFDMDAEDMKKMMDIMKNMPNLGKMYEEAKKTLLEESINKNKGDMESSLSDDGKI